MAAPSMVSRSGDNLIVRSVVSGDALYGTEEKEDEEFNLFDQSFSGEEEDTGGELPQCKIKRNYTCPLCDYYTQNPRFFLYHQKQVHKEKIKIYECAHCLYASKHSQKLQRHIHMVHVMGAGKRKLIKPKIKPKSPPKQAPAAIIPSHPIYEAEEHDEDQEPLYAADGTQVYKCSVCDMTSKSQGLVARHERIVHLKRKFYRCGKCNYVTHMKARYTKHVKYHSMPMIKCDLCDFKTPYKWNLDRHNKNHMGDGPFKCSVCNFAADIKQSLTVHEMNHHVPPVGHIVSTNRRRLKVGASDTMGLVTEEDQIEQSELELLKMEREGAFDQNPADFVQTQLDFPSDFYTHPAEKRIFLKETPIVIPVDEDARNNKLIQIKKYNCRMCDFKGNLGEVQRHEAINHNFKALFEKKKTPRPIPNLIPIQGGQSVLKPSSERKINISEESINNICHNSSLKDFAPIINDEFKKEQNQADDNSTSPSSGEGEKKIPEAFKRKNASFFDKLKEKLMTSASESNLTCSYCGHEAKCLSEHMKHQKSHMQTDMDELSENSTGSQNVPVSELSSTRCQHCRHRCKSSTDLMIHLQTCTEANNQNPPIKSEEEEEEEDAEEEQRDNDNQSDQTHPMENKVFVWNSLADSLMNDSREEEFSRSSHEMRPYIVAADEVDKPLKPPEKSFIGVELKPGYGTTTIDGEPEKHGLHKDHNVKKVYKCPHCTFWASTASRFHVHIVGHLNKRPFQCSLCYYSSNWRWDITKHIRLKTLRDPSHEKAKVLLTDETGRRNYSKYNKYLTTMHMETTASKSLRKIQPKEPSQKEIQPNEQFPPQAFKRSSTDQKHEDSEASPKKKQHLENKKTMWKCKKCYFRDSDRNIVLAHVKEHYKPSSSDSQAKTQSQQDQSQQNEEPMNLSPPQTDNEDNEEKSLCPNFMCETCPFICQTWNELEAHAEKHFVHQGGTNFKCQFCKFFAHDKEELMEHLDSHNESEAGEIADSKNVVFACLACPYVATSKAQLIYHRKGHSNESQHKCHKCTYSAPNNTILALHVRLHCKYSPENSDHSPMKSDRIEADISGVDTSKLSEIPMVWVSRPMGISKLFKCRFCPHINMRKNNIQDHEKMHVNRQPPTFLSQMHQCNECSYICNNAGVLSSHMKVHQAHFGQVVGVVDPTRTDSEQIAEMKAKLNIKDQNETPPKEDPQNTSPIQAAEDLANVERDKDDRILHFCSVCPARFLYAKEMAIHVRFHQLQLPFKCVSCSYTARQKTHLVAHLKVHSDEYQGRTNVLAEMYETAEENPRPKAIIIENDQCEKVWVVEKPEGSPEKIQDWKKKNFACHKCPAEFFKIVALNYHLTLHGGPGPHKCRYCDYAVKTYGNLTKHESVHQGGTKVAKTKKSNDNVVPASGTELYKQKNEANAAAQKLSPLKQSPPPPLINDPEFGVLIHGSPEFIYPTYYKNGKLKEKRYKCHKCPSAFEKREQYKIHLSLHGSKQRYNCERCDYSVKYYANYSQHLKKHEQNDACQKERKHSSGDKSEDTGEEMEVAEGEPIASQPVMFERGSKSLKMSVADQQALMLMHQKNVTKPINEKEVINRCSECPYANNRKDGVNSHRKCHTDEKTNQYACKYCNYNVPQPHYLREHLKVHFSPLKFVKPEAYMKVDKLEIWAEPLDPNHNFDKFLVFKDQGETFNEKDRYLPKRENDVSSIKGRVYINLKTGEEEVEMDDIEENELKVSSYSNENKQMEDQTEQDSVLQNGTKEDEEDEEEEEEEENEDEINKMETEETDETGSQNVNTKENGIPDNEMTEDYKSATTFNSDSEESCDSSNGSSCSQLTTGTNNQD